MNTKSKIINETSGEIEVQINPNIIAEELQGKLSSSDIELSCTSAMRQVNYKTHCFDIEGCSKECPYAGNIMKALPNGCLDADIMIVNHYPTLYEANLNSSGIDTGAAFLAMVFSKMNIKRNVLWWTDLVKCPQVEGESSPYLHCVEYLSKEINNIQPKLIICNGLIPLKYLAIAKIIRGLPSKLDYGTIYDVAYNTANENINLNTKIMSIYNIDEVLKVEDAEKYNQIKAELWKHLVNAVNTIYKKG